MTSEEFVPSSDRGFGARDTFLTLCVNSFKIFFYANFFNVLFLCM